MGFTCGIVGLPNVGKSTIFNALTATTKAESENYPFCTTNPNKGRVRVPDNRLNQLALLAGSEEVIPAHLDFADIAGLVSGASKGEGLGNQFLAHIKEVDAILHVLRCFQDSDITHIYNKIDPISDAETVETELMISDLESLERRIEPIRKKSKGADKEATSLLTIMEPVLSVLRDGQPASSAEIPLDRLHELNSLQLLTTKPILYVCNVDENSLTRGNIFAPAVGELAKKRGAGYVVISAAIEAEIALINDPEEKNNFLRQLGLEYSGLLRTIQAGYRLLNLITFFTCGPKQTRAWTVPDGTKALHAAGRVHSDFARGFIKAETIHVEDYIRFKGEAEARNKGKMRLEGRDYYVQDGDVMNFRFSI